MLSSDQVKQNPERVIWLADFYYHESVRTKGRGVVTMERDGIAKNIPVVGSDRIKIIKNRLFLSRVYQKLYGKEKWQKRFDEKTLTITKIDLKKPLSLSFAPEYR